MNELFSHIFLIKKRTFKLKQWGGGKTETLDLIKAAAGIQLMIIFIVD